MKMKRILSVSMLCVMALMAFAPGAASVTIEPKGDNPKDHLEQNSLVGEWSDAFGRYNCYSYVLGITDFWHSPGDFVGLPRPGILPASQLAERVKMDLNALGYSCVSVHSNFYTEPQAEQKLICVRAGSENSNGDFHLMRYEDGEWYHKPGGNWIMRFTDEMDEDVAWLNEYAFMRLGNIVYMQVHNNGEVSYAGDIYYLAYQEEHGDDVYDYMNESQHAVMCPDCSMTYRVESHSLYRPLGANYRTCSKCYVKIYDSGIILTPMEEDDRVIM